MGHPQLATDTSRVRRWIDMGETPRDPVPKVLAALFTERLGRVVTIEDLGFGTARARGEAAGRRDADNPDGLPWAPERTAAVLTEFTGMDLMLNRRGLVGAGAALAAGSALTSAMHDWLHTDPALAADAPRPRRPPRTRDPAGFDRYEAAPVGSQEIEALERSVEVFRAWDAARGGGLQRKAVVGQLNEVGGMLAYRHPDHLQRRLWGVAANLAVLAGWMSHDVGLEPTAQKYFVIAAHAAREGGDRPRAGEALSRAARQMVHLGRPDDALDLMKLAKSGSGRAGPAAHPGHAAHHRGLGAGVHGPRPGDAPHPRARPRSSSSPTRAMCRRRAGCRCSTRRTCTACRPWPTAPSPSTSRRRPASRSGTPSRRWSCGRTGRQRSQIFDYISLASACFIADDPEQADRYARLALVTMGETSSHRTWDRLREMYRLTGQYAAYARSRTCVRRSSMALPKAEAQPQSAVGRRPPVTARGDPQTDAAVVDDR